MAFWDKWFGGGKKGQTLPEIKYTTPQQTEAGKTALDLLKSRASGQGVAFNPEQLTMYGNPYAEKAMRGYEKVLQPAIAESYASRGLSKSNLGAGAETDALGNVLSDIGTNWAELNKWNEALKQSGIKNASSGLRDYMGQELNQANNQAGYDYTKATGENAYNDSARQDTYNKNMAGIKMAMDIGGGVASMFTPQGALSQLLKKQAPRTATTTGGYKGYDTSGAINYLKGF